MIYNNLGYFRNLISVTLIYVSDLSKINLNHYFPPPLGGGLSELPGLGARMLSPPFIRLLWLNYICSFFMAISYS